jgi:hypothetical protein
VLTIKVWCLQGDLAQKMYEDLHKKLVAAMVDIKHLNIRDENDLLVLFPKDLMQYGLGNELLIEFGGSPQLEGQYDRWYSVVGERLALTVKYLFPNARIFLKRDPTAVEEYKM